nr:unnamed protein product [Callosobruchus chinensis]
MRGLPYDCTAKQVLDFFASGDNPCHVMDGVDGVLFVRKPDGRATGDAFVLFAEESDSPKALTKHRECIGARYIELFRSTTAEVQQVLNRSMDSKPYDPVPLLAQLPLPVTPFLPQRIITSGTSKDCIRLRGLPYEAQVEHILEFLGEHAKNIVFRGVHMVYNAQGQPSGEAFIQMDSEQSAFVAAHLKHHHYMTFGKKQRYIEVFQCSGEDMNLVLTGGLPHPRVVSPAAAPKQPATAAVRAAQVHAVAAAAAHDMLSLGMLPTPAAQSAPPTTANLPPPPPNSAAPPPPQSWENPALFAQQQAQIIAQQNLLARQSQAQAAQAQQNDIMFMNQLIQHNLAMYNQQQPVGQAAASTNAAQMNQMLKSQAASVPMMSPLIPNPYMMFQPRIPLTFQRPPQLTYPQLMQGQTPGVIPMTTMQQMPVKRSYGDAFAEQATPAKRQFAPATTLPAVYPQFYSNM